MEEIQKITFGSVLFIKQKITMKKIGSLFFVLLLVFSSCKHHHHGGHGNPGDPEEVPYSALIPIDTANKMIQSYLDGINYTVNTEAIKALCFNADSLRAYLSDPTIKDIKFVFANTLEYANSPHGHERPDSNSHVTTLILAGYDNKGNYVFKDNMVYENLRPCPNECIQSGTASRNLLVEPK